MKSQLEKSPKSTGAQVDATSTGFVIVAAVGGLLFEYDTAAISGAVIFIKQEFSLSTFPEELVVGMVLVGAATAALGGGRHSDRPEAKGRTLEEIERSLNRRAAGAERGAVLNA